MLKDNIDDDGANDVVDVYLPQMMMAKLGESQCVCERDVGVC